MKLYEYIKKRNGVSLGHPDSLKNNLYRSFGANNFSIFWNFWNPIFGYYLGMKIFKPLKRVIPISIALVFTFIFCGLLHDAVTSLVRMKISLFFSVWFFIMGIVVVVSKKMKYNLSSFQWYFRAIVNSLIIVICFILTNILNSKLNFY